MFQDICCRVSAWKGLPIQAVTVPWLAGRGARRRASDCWKICQSRHPLQLHWSISTLRSPRSNYRSIFIVRYSCIDTARRKSDSSSGSHNPLQETVASFPTFDMKPSINQQLDLESSNFAATTCECSNNKRTFHRSCIRDDAFVSNV